MDWSILIAAVIEAIVECLKERNRDRIEFGLNNPGFREAFALRRVLRDQGMRGRELRLTVDDGMTYLAGMTVEDVACLMDDADAVLRGEEG